MFPFESVAYAQAGGAEANPFVSFVPLILIVVVFWFFLIRPQQKRQKEHQKMISELGKGDRIVTTGGLFGTITKIGEDRMTVEIADKVRVQIERGRLQRPHAHLRRRQHTAAALTQELGVHEELDRLWRGCLRRRR